MAEYYPLLARAVAGLKTSTPQARRLIYERARNALLAQLRAMTPPVPEPDIQRESDALDAAIARLETEFGAADAPAQAESDRLAADEARNRAERARAAQEKAAQEQAAQEQAAREQATQEQAAREKLAQERLAQERLAQERAAQAKAEQDRAAQEKAAREKAERETAEREKAEQAAREEAEAQARRAAAAREEQRLAAERAERERREAEARHAAEQRARLEAEAAAKPAVAAPPAPAKPVSERPASEKPLAGPAGQNTLAGVAPFGVAPEIRVDRDGAPGEGAPLVAPQRHDGPEPKAAFPNLTAERASYGGVGEGGEDNDRARATRPAAPLPPPERRSNLRYILAGGGLALVIGGLAYAAWVLRDQPQETTRPNVAQETKPVESGKIVDRVGVSPSAPVPTVQAPAEAIRPNAGKLVETPAPAPTSADVAAPARAAFLIQSEGPEQHRTYAGSVNWRFADGAWRAEVSVPEVKLALSLAMTKATDDGPASHKIDLRFQSDDPSLQIARAGVPEMRKEENPYGDRLAAVAVQVTPSVYLIGLRKAEADVAYNLELIKSRGWIDVPLEMTDKRIAKITFEKGPAGDATLAQALKAWGG